MGVEVMETKLKLTLIIGLIIILMLMIHSVKKDDISVKYSMVWLICIMLMGVAILIPNLLEKICNFLGFELVSNMIFLICIAILFIISFTFTVIVSRQTKKIRLLIQEVSILKSEVEKIGEKVNEKE